MIPWWTLPLIVSTLSALFVTWTCSAPQTPYRGFLVFGMCVFAAAPNALLWALCYLLSLMMP